MSRFVVGYDFGTSTVTVEGTEEVAERLGELAGKTPQVMQRAINQTATETKNRMIRQAKLRYAVNAKGREKLNGLKVKKKANRSDLTAVLFISSMRNDLGYFQSKPSTPLMGHAPKPEFFTGRVLKKSVMKPLTGTGNLSKGFLVEFKSGHVGMVQRIIGAPSRSTVTARGKPRWKSASGVVEKVQTMGSPSASAMHGMVWDEVRPDVREILERKTEQQIERLLRKGGKG